MKEITVEYFAVFSQERGKQKETLSTSSQNLNELFGELKEKFGFKLAQENVRVALNQQVVGWDTPLKSGDIVLFIPPIVGG